MNLAFAPLFSRLFGGVLLPLGSPLALACPSFTTIEIDPLMEIRSAVPPEFEPVLIRRFKNLFHLLYEDSRRSVLPSFFLATLRPQKPLLLISFSAEDRHCIAHRPALWMDAALVLDTLTDDANRLWWHEIFHLVHDTLRPQEDNWLREGLALAFEHRRLGKINGQVVDAAFRAPHSLLFSFMEFPFSAEFYGIHATWIDYVLRRCGDQSLFWRLVTSSRPESGLAFLTQMMSQIACPLSDLRRDFTISRWHNRPAEDGMDPRFQLTTTSHRWQPPQFSTTEEIISFLKNPTVTAAVVKSQNLANEIERLCPSCTLIWREGQPPYQLSSSVPLNSRLGSIEILILKPF